MNPDHVLFPLGEAETALAQLIEELRSNDDYDIGEYRVAMQHLFHHLNTAWNGRDATAEEGQEVTDAAFNKWGRYPDPEDLPPLEV